MEPIIKDNRPEAALVLADGTYFKGRSIGAAGMTVGEVVFNTAMTGYQEIITDPSYKGQLVTLTYPHIGNVGVNHQDAESRKIFAAGLIIRSESPVVSNFRAEQSLGQYLKEAGKIGIAEIDTRRLTRLLRTQGAQPGAIVAAKSGALTDAELEAAKEAAANAPVMTGQDLAKVVTAESNYEWSEGTWQPTVGDRMAGFQLPDTFEFHVVAWDFGVKKNILRLMADRGIKVTVVPANTSYEEAMQYNPDGVFLSNGPGDPAPCTYAIEVARKAIAAKKPLFGICLGHQILGLANAAKTEKMKFGHHGANHPVVDLKTRRVYITSQNHGFMVNAETLPANACATHVSLFDNSLQGFELTDAPVFCFQGHPEASPGPHDIQDLFDRFVDLMRSAQ